MDFIINFSKPMTGNFIVDIIVWIVGLTSSIAAGIVLFTLLLKLITLPFDYVSRASMRKNSIKMEEMRPELEKLQKQYANNQDLYKQKMMALYKKNGYSMFGACLPTILTLVIFIFAINGFTAYSKYQNKMYFYNMSTSYNNVIYTGLEQVDNYIYYDKDGNLVIENEKIYDDAVANGNVMNSGSLTATVTNREQTIEDEQGNPIVTKYAGLTVSTLNGYVEFFVEGDITTDENNPKWLTDNVSYKIIKEKLEDYTSINPALINDKNNNLKITIGKNEYTYSEMMATKDIVTGENALMRAHFNDYFEMMKVLDTTLAQADQTVIDAKYTEFANDYHNYFIRDIQQTKAAETYRSEQASFLWVKNIWATDSPMAHPIASDWNTFKVAHGYLVLNSEQDIGNEGYQNLIAKLDYEKVAPNGFFILVVLTAASSFIMQKVMNKGNKAQMELQTVNGQGMQTQKMMTVIMPLMMAVFAFMYTSAFSIYIILSSVISMLTTIAINKFVDKRYKKKAGIKEGQKQVIRGRVHNEPVKEEVKPVRKTKQQKEIENDSFLSGKNDKKKNIRGRLK